MNTYDPGSVLVTFAGNVITGFSDGTMIEASRDEDAFTKKVGADGEVVRTQNRNRAGSVRFVLLQSSAANDLLSAAAAADELTRAGIGPLLVRDNLGRTVIQAQNAWVRKLPSVAFEKEAGDREWVIDVDYLNMLVGGAGIV